MCRYQVPLASGRVMSAARDGRIIQVCRGSPETWDKSNIHCDLTNAASTPLGVALILELPRDNYKVYVRAFITS